MGTFQKLFQPGNIGALRLDNRLVLAPMGLPRADALGRVTDELIAFEIGMSISLYFPATGTAGLLRRIVNGASREPRPPPRINTVTSRSLSSRTLISFSSRIDRISRQCSRSRCACKVETETLTKLTTHHEVRLP